MKLRDTFRALHPDATRYKTHHGYSGGSLEGGTKIDYVMATEDLKVAFPSPPTDLRPAARGFTALTAPGAAGAAGAAKAAWDALGVLRAGTGAAGIQFRSVQSMPKRKFTPGG